MANGLKLFIAAGVCIAVLVSVLVFHGLNACVLSETQAKQMVLAELSRSGLDPKFLQGPTRSPGSCSFDFLYEGNGRKISYIAADDFLHGPELHRWDYAEDANGP